AQQIEKAVTAPMKATLESDSQKVLTPPNSAEVKPEAVAEVVDTNDNNGSSPEAAVESAETDPPA
ncbi:MAG: hypothetical protein WBB18_13620, partial [Nodosilinea sp.]